MVPITALVDRELRAALRKFDVVALERSPDVVYVLGAQLRLRFVNERYREVASSCPGEVLDRYPLGAAVLPAIDPTLRDHYRSLYTTALRNRAPRFEEYSCPTPTEMADYRCALYPLDGHGVLVVHSRLTHRPWTDDELERLRHVDGELLRMCAGCRRIRSPEGEWLYVPRVIEETPDGTSHGLCEPCSAHYLGATGAQR